MALKLIGEVALDGSGWDRGLSKMASSVKSFVMTAFGIYGVQQALQKTFETANELVHASQRLGIGVESLQVLREAAKQSGTELEAVTLALEKLEVARYRASQGGDRGKRVVDAFRDLGITPEMLKSGSREDLFFKIAGAAKSRNQAELAGPMMQLFSESFGRVMPALQTDFDELSASMKKVGAIMDTDTAVSIEALGNQFSLLSNIIAVQLGSILISLAEGIFRIVGALASWWAWFKGLTGGNSEVSAAIMANTPGYGGWNPGQKEGMEAARRMSLKPNGGGINAAEDAFAKEAAKWNKSLDDIKEKMEKAANALKNPPPRKPPGLDEPDIKATKVKIAKGDSGDALTRVGNFLGASRSTLETIGERQVNFLAKIAANTLRMAANGSSGSIFPPL